MYIFTFYNDYHGSTVVVANDEDEAAKLIQKTTAANYLSIEEIKEMMEKYEIKNGFVFEGYCE